jgi:hypothetical protein
LLLGMAGIIAFVFATRPVLAGDKPAASMSQAQYLELLAKATADTASLPENAATADYVKWAVQQGIQPDGGWKPNAPLTRDVFAQTLAQVYGVTGQKDPARELEKVGVVIPSSKALTAKQVGQVFYDFGFQSPTALASSNPGTPVGPRQRVAICHRPPGNPGKRITIVVAETALPAHLAHGDTLGPCD